MNSENAYLAEENCEENGLNTLGMSDAVSFISPDQRRRGRPAPRGEGEGSAEAPGLFSGAFTSSCFGS